MKVTFVQKLAGLAAWAALLPTAASAQTTSFSATGWVNGLLTPGLLATNAPGQVLMRGVVHTSSLLGSEARVTGHVLNVGNGSYNADGSANIQGTAYVQLGTWDAAHTNFTPTAGMWEVPWRGVMQADFSLQLSLTGYGSGGAIDGFRLEGTLTRAKASAPIDPTVPYIYAGTIKPPPVSSTLVSVGFTNGAPGWTLWGLGTFSTNNSQLVEHTTGAAGDMHLLRSPIQSWSLADGQTLECQADLASVTDNGLDCARLWVGNDEPLAYELELFAGRAALLKWDMVGGSLHPTCFWLTNNAQLRPGNLTLYLALTRNGESVMLNTRVLDKANQSAVLLESTFTDTPGVDPSLSTDQVETLIGITYPFVPDSRPPLLSGTQAGVGLIQFAPGPAQAVWDNFSVRLHDEPPISIARAVQLTWPNPAGVNYAVECAPILQGPWLPVQDLQTPGLQKLAVPITDPMQVFRLRQTP